jgi:hypothetical protein
MRSSPPLGWVTCNPLPVGSRPPGGYIQTPSRARATGCDVGGMGVNWQSTAVHSQTSPCSAPLVDWMSPDFRVRGFRRLRKVRFGLS